MNSMGVRPALAVLLLFIAAVEAGEGGVTVWREYFTMTCPGEGSWYYKKQNVSEGATYQLKYEHTKKGLYYCEYYEDPEFSETNKMKYYFYVQGKVCENCFELDASLFGLAIAADVIGTAFVMMIVYRCTKKKESSAHASKAPARSGGQGPPVSSSHYEQLNTHTRSQDTYSIVNRTG
ncbi:T-cell surface glycoprotein CD3 epsilon chain-like [Enoplosus armatus]|uniref:T-cell surface glycoprotein CD3 epsilon chain-like n=1 Tax=Enoplosus armatus TaxID=215367 RepID=UPI00399599CE